MKRWYNQFILAPVAYKYSLIVKIKGNDHGDRVLILKLSSCQQKKAHNPSTDCFMEMEGEEIKTLRIQNEEASTWILKSPRIRQEQFESRGE